MRVGARDDDVAGLDRLAQRLEHRRGELGQLVEEQHAIDGRGDLARPGARAAADHAPPSRRNDAARGTAAVREHAASVRSPASEWIIETSSTSAGSSGGRIDGSRAASIDLPEPGGPTISRLWPPAAAISSARLARSWPLMSARSDAGAGPADLAGLGRFKHLSGR